jgi:Na+/H+-dicarboxylate symporter
MLWRLESSIKSDELLSQLERFGVSPRITSFVLPMDYSFNLDGPMMYCTFATIFIAQAYNIPLSLGTEIAMLLLLIAATLTTFNIPEAGLLLIMGIESDSSRSVVGIWTARSLRIP